MRDTLRKIQAERAMWHKKQKRARREAMEASGRTYQSELQATEASNVSLGEMLPQPPTGLEILFAVDRVPFGSLPIVSIPPGTKPLVFDKGALQASDTTQANLILPWQEGSTWPNAGLDPGEEAKATWQAVSLQILRVLRQHYLGSIRSVASLDDLPPGRHLPIGNNCVFVVKIGPDQVAYYGRRDKGPQTPPVFAFAIFRPEDIDLYEITGAHQEAGCPHPTEKQELSWDGYGSLPRDP